MCLFLGEVVDVPAPHIKTICLGHQIFSQPMRKKGQDSLHLHLKIAGRRLTVNHHSTGKLPSMPFNMSRDIAVGMVCFKCIACGERLDGNRDAPPICSRCGGKVFIALRPSSIKKIEAK